MAEIPLHWPLGYVCAEDWSISKDSGSREDSGCSKSSGSAAITPWIPASLSRRNGTATEQDRLEAIRRGVRSSLNKLTPENFERIADDLTNVALKSETILTSVIDLIFRKALEEPQYNSLYAQLCRRLSDFAVNKDIFKRVLLTEVQNVYNKRSGLPSSSAEAVSNGSVGTKDEKRRKKQEHLSNIKFIGELGKLDLLHGQILHLCIQELLNEKSATSIADKAEDLECLCQMMRIIGSSLDSRATDKVLMDGYIQQLKGYSDTTALPSRIRFLCLDVVELRSNKWIPRRIHQSNAPKTMFEIREEIRAEIGAAKADVMEATRLSPQREGALNTRHANSPRTTAEKQQDLRNGIMSSGRMLNGKGDYNRGSGNAAKTVTPIKDNRSKPLLNLLRQDANEPAREIVLRPITSFAPQRPIKQAEPVRTVKEAAPVAPLRPQPAVPIKEEAPNRQEKPKTGKPAQAMNKNEAIQAVSTVVTEYFALAKDRPHAVANMKEFNIPKRLKPDLVGLLLKMGMEQGEVNRESICNLIAHLVCESWVTESDIIEGYERLLDALDSGSCDPKPCMAVYLADFIASGILSFKNGVNLFENGKHFPVALMCLQHLEQNKGADYLAEQIVADKTDLLKLFPEKDLKMGVDHVVEVLNTYGLTYLCPSYRLQAHLGRLLMDGNTSADIDQWLADNAQSIFNNKTDFIFNLMISLVKHSHYQSILLEKKAGDSMDQTRVNEEKLKKSILNYKKLFHKYLDSHLNQLTALYAVQTFYHSIGFPKGWVLCWFCMLHELDIVEPETFNMWRDEVNNAYPEKGKALFQVSAWLEWLNTVESDSETEEDGSAEPASAGSANG
ncbi:eukaryotic translation initiation factor 4 gamma 2-like [Paramacrobiotus metropolitanus]|uniref:eukaryotic translation initiation factor 4 gamma 2-like n=1 Tax=Paramacrobiotus metropolitanus TaxID=2943436 RepID=UPI002445C125|nr:eukaryotic translation initiation factor 4 gamma 2-like [Paramacrobiotus metropolitanus]